MNFLLPKNFFPYDKSTILGTSSKHFTFGSKASQPLSTSVTSRSRSRKSTDLYTDVITVSGGTYQLKVGGVWQTATASPGTWGTATAIRLIGTSSASYETSVEVTGTINGIADVFTIVTMEEYIEFGNVTLGGETVILGGESVIF
jgi:hypothetical protein